MSRLHVSDLSLRFPGQERPLLSRVSFQLDSGDRALLLGPSGSGKSSLLLALTGLLPRSVEAEVAGQIWLGGRPVGDLTPAAICRQVGLLFQEPESQFCMLKPDDEVAFGLENLGVAPTDMEGRINAAMKAAGLGPAQRRQRIDRLSGGQQQRLALASILAQSPDLLLMDEPTANLDPAGRREVVSAAADAAAAGKGLLVVEHHLDPWFPLLNRLLLLAPDGQLLDDGTPGELFARWGRYLAEIGVWRPLAVQVAEQISLTHPLPLTAQDLAAVQAPPTAMREALHAVCKPRSPAVRTEGQPPVAEIHSVTAGYPGGGPILHDVSLSVGPGDFWAIVGPNGSGKSTLARTLIGMVKPMAGRVTLLGTDVDRLKAGDLAERVGYVFQNPEHQFVTDSVWEELAYSVRQRKLAPHERQERVEWALRFFGLEAVKAANPFSLSGGQKRRLSVATMLVGGQRLLILDEPTFGQDQQNAERLMERMAELNLAGVTILMITHDMELVDRYASQAALVLDGRIRYAGAVPGLWREPALLAQGGLELPFRVRVEATLAKREATPC